MFKTWGFRVKVLACKHDCIKGYIEVFVRLSRGRRQQLLNFSLVCRHLLLFPETKLASHMLDVLVRQPKATKPVVDDDASMCATMGDGLLRSGKAKLKVQITTTVSENRKLKLKVGYWRTKFVDSGLLVHVSS